MKRVLVIGAGVVGLFSALYALRRGYEVTVVDRDPADMRSCSYGNAGMVVPSHFIPLAAPGMVARGLRWMLDPASPFHVKPRISGEFVSWALRFVRAATREHVARAAPLLRDLAMASRACYDALAGESGNAFGLQCNGLLLVCRTAHALEEECGVAQQARSLGMSAMELDTAAARAMHPMLRDDVAGAIHYPIDCHLDPDRLMAWLNARVVAEGARVLRDTEVTGFVIERDRLRAARTRIGDVEGDEFVLCGGVWSPTLVRTLALSLPIEAGKGYSVTVRKPASFGAHCAILSEARVAVTPMGDRLRVGGTMQLAGIDSRIDPRRVRAVIDALPRYYRDFDRAELGAATPWAGLRPCTPDGLPYIGRARRYANLTIAAGHAMMGVSLGAVTGSIVSALIAGEAPPFDMALLSPNRFH